jgi:hypothetical protein
MRRWHWPSAAAASLAAPLFSALLNYRHSDETELLEPSRQAWQGIEPWPTKSAPTIR